MILAEIDDSNEVTELNTLHQHDDTALIQFKSTMPLLLLSVQGTGVLLEMLFLLEDSGTEQELTASQHRLSELETQLEQFGIPFTANDIYQCTEPEQLLTDRQLQLLIVVVEQRVRKMTGSVSERYVGRQIDPWTATVDHTVGSWRWLR